jgi:hypothetical protein
MLVPSVVLNLYRKTYRNSYPKALSGSPVGHVIRHCAALPVHSEMTGDTL